MISRKRKEWRTTWSIRRRQSPIKGGRFSASTGLSYEVAQWVEAECKRYGVGKSFVLQTAAATMAKIRTERYFVPTDGKRARK